MKDSSFLENPRAWYTKGRVYHEILKSDDPNLNQFKGDLHDLASVIVEAYNRTKALTSSGSNLHTLSGNHLEILWADGINKGVSYFQSQDFVRAVEAFSISKIVKPSDTTAHAYVGYSAQNAQKFDIALESFNTVKQLATPSKSIHNGIIICTQALGKSLTDQLEVIEQALFDYPDHIPYVLREVSALVNLGRYTEAESRLQTVHQRNPDAYELKIRQADLFHEIFNQAFFEGRPDRSDRYFDKAAMKYEEYIDQFPDNFTANYNYAAMINEKANRYYVRGNLMTETEFEISGEQVQEEGHILTRKALPYMEKARKLRPNDEKVINVLRVFYKRLKMDEKLAALDNQ